LSDAIVTGLGFLPEERPQTARAFAQLLSRQQPPLGATERAPVAAPVLGPTEGALGTRGHVDRTLVRPQEPAPPLPSPTIVAPPPLPSSRGASKRLPLAIAAAVLVLVAATVAATVWRTPPPPEQKAEFIREVPPGQPKEPDTPPEPRDGTTGTSTPLNQPVEKPRPAAEKKPDVAPGPRQPAVTPTVGAQRPVPAPRPAPPLTGVLVVILGDDPDATRQAEAVILQALIGRGGLQALDPDGLSMLRRDSAALQAAGSGNFTALAAMGREQGAEVMVVGDLRSRGVPSINRFYTGTAELNVKMYRTSTGRLVDTQTFIVGQGGSQPVMAISDIEARSRAAAQAANDAAQAIAGWAAR
jgi:hypothetical protein